MSNEDRYHTTSWDGDQVRREEPAPHSSAQRSRQTGSGGTGGKKKKKKRGNPLLNILLWLVIVAVSSAILAGVGWMLANDLCALNKTPPNEDPKEITVKVEEGWHTGTETFTKKDKNNVEKEYTAETYDMKQVAAMLKEKGLIEYEWFFRLFSWVMHGERKVGAGSYKLNTDMDYRALIYGMMPGGDTEVAETVDVTIPEGYTVAQIIALLAEKGVSTEEKLTDAAANHVFEGYGFVDNENLGSITRLEGYLYPDTYNFYVGRDPAIAFNAMLNNFKKQIYTDSEISGLLSDWEESGYSFSDIITIASLIEKETDGTDRDKIASVIYNRLKNAGETNYLLQIDAALVYAAGRPITQADYTDLDSPYNLYQHTGLPPTPIANPGRQSILAALQPASTNYYFYVLDGKTHVFSETLAQHQKAVAAASGGN